MAQPVIVCQRGATRREIVRPVRCCIWINSPIQKEEIIRIGALWAVFSR